jgi:phage terminase small subunit
MPRKSAEQRSAELWRIGHKPPPPPADLSSTASKLWRKIIIDKPGDFWSPALLALLQAFCETSDHSRRVVTRLAELPVDDPAALALARALVANNSSLCNLAQKMRLSAQNLISPQARAQLTERGAVLDSDDLIGVAALRWRSGGSRPAVK